MPAPAAVAPRPASKPAASKKSSWATTAVVAFLLIAGVRYWVSHNESSPVTAPPTFIDTSGGGQSFGVPGTGGTNTYAYPGTACRASSVISGGKVNWNFCDLERNQISWSFPVDSYQQYGSLPHPRDPLTFRTDSGTRFRINDVRSYITPSFFDNVIDDLTTGRTDKQFVLEAFNVKQSFVNYASSYIDDQKAYQYPAETMTQGTGICGDTTILLASLINAGNAAAHYGLHLEVYYVEMNTAGDGLVMPPTTANHVFLGIIFQDGSRWFVESTAKTFYTWTQVQGWDETVEDYTTPASTSRSGQQTTAPPPAPQSTTTLFDNQQGRFSAGDKWGAKFQLYQTARVDYDYAYQGSGTVDICIIRESDAQAWQGAQSGGWACHAAVNSASGSATIAAGVYYLAFLCDNTFVDCKVAFSASATD